MIRVIGVLATVLVVTACGGGSSNRNSISDSFANLPGGTDQQQLLEEMLAELPGVTDPDRPIPVPAVRTLDWPSDFPTTIVAGLTDSVLVRGLQQLTAYDFDVTLPTSVDGEDATLFAMNLDTAGQTGSPVCYGDPDCTGTITANQISLQLVSFSSGTATISISRSSTPSLVNEGSDGNPLVLDLSAESVTHPGTIGGTQAVQNQLQSSRSFYRLTNLAVGDRYVIELTEPSDNDVALAFNEAQVQCDPAYSGAARCVFIAGSAEFDFSVTGDFVLFGGSFNVKVNRFNDAARFEGSWHSPIALSVPEAAAQHHFGHADRYSSYYTLTGLDPSRRYRLRLTGNNSAARLKLNSPLTSLPVFAPQCGAVDEEKSFGDQYCTIERAIYAYFRVESVDAESRYLVSIEPGAANEGSQVAPLALQYRNSRLLHNGEVNTESYYTLDGLTVGEQYLLQLNAATSFPTFALSSSAGDEIDCSERGLSHCIFTADSVDLSLAVADNGTDIGERFKLSVLPIDPADTARPSPFAEDLSLAVGSLPHTGTVSDFYSNYIISGLNANQYYLAAISQHSESVSFAAWPATASGIQCIFSHTRLDSTGCLVPAGSDGQLRVRVGGDSGGQFEISVQDAAVLSSEYQSLDTPLVIADDSVDGVISTIEVSDSQAAGIVEVVLQIAHGYSSDLVVRLEAPDGQTVTLADHIPGTTFAHTTYTDLASEPNPSGSQVHALQRYRPVEPLHILRDTSATGVWRLHVADDTYSNRTDALGGTLLGWGLSFR